MDTHSFEEFAETQLTLAANEENATCFSLAPCGELTVKVTEVMSELKAMSYQALRHDEDDKTFLLTHRRGFVAIDLSSSAPLSLYTLDKDEVARLRERFGHWVRRDDEEGPGALYMLLVEYGQLHFSAVGNAGKLLRRENYASTALEAFDHAMADLGSDDPCGRLVLLTGPPGTGKTYLVRGMLAAVERPKFVLVQASDVKRFLDASPLSALRAFARKEAKGRPIAFVIEDADACLLPRGNDNFSELSAVLNMSDGLVGAALDLRIIATTNARHIDIDPAVMRPGRTCRRIDVPALEADQAQRVLAGLAAGKARFVFDKAATLAEVYAKARELDPRQMSKLGAKAST